MRLRLRGGPLVSRLVRGKQEDVLLAPECVDLDLRHHERVGLVAQSDKRMRMAGFDLSARVTMSSRIDRLKLPVSKMDVCCSVVALCLIFFLSSLYWMSGQPVRSLDCSCSRRPNFMTERSPDHATESSHSRLRISLPGVSQSPSASHSSSGARAGRLQHGHVDAYCHHIDAGHDRSALGECAVRRAADCPPRPGLDPPSVVCRHGHLRTARFEHAHGTSGAHVGVRDARAAA